MKVLVTGGAGFIGSHLVERLVANGHKVVVFDNLSTGNIKNLDSVKEKIQFHLGDVSVAKEVPYLHKYIQDSDLVVHLAAVVGIFLVMENPYKCLVENIQGTHHVVSGCIETGTPMILASTSEVYGKRDKLEPLCEWDDVVYGHPYNHRWSYATSKLADEHLVIGACKNVTDEDGGLHATIFRFFNTVGPRQSPAYGMVLPRFVKQALKNEPLTVFGNGEQIRCFTYVDDTVESVMRFIEWDKWGIDPKSWAGFIYNIGSRQPVMIKQLAQRVIDLLGSESRIVYSTYKNAYGEGYEDMMYRVPNVARLESRTNFAPSIGLDEIIIKTAEYMREELENDKSEELQPARV